MNKLFIIFLAVCLINVHAFVKRDTAEAASEKNLVDDLKKQLEDFAKNTNEQFKETFDPDNIKKAVNDLTDAVNKALDDLKKSQETSKQ